MELTWIAIPSSLSIDPILAAAWDGGKSLTNRTAQGALSFCHRRKLTSLDPHKGHHAQKTVSISEEARKIAWKAQPRLHKRYKAMAARGKDKNQIVTEIGRELLGFIWAIAIETEEQQKLAKAA